MPLSILTCSQHFTDLALNELRRHVSNISPLSELSPGCLLLHSSLSFNRLTYPWRHRLPIYLHHLCPAHFSVHLKGHSTDLPIFTKIVKQKINTEQLLIVQPRILSQPNGLTPCYSTTDITAALNDVVQSPTLVSTTPNGKILSIIVTPDKNSWRAYFGVSMAHHNLSPWPGGVQPPSVNMPNRAGYKLLEALETFKIKLRENNRALDLGAAPGAWTLVLRQHGMHVTAVSPKRLYLSLRKDRYVFHRQMDAETYLKQVEGTFDFITNDMGMAAQDSARLMVSYAQYLHSSGVAIMTLKLRQHNRRRRMDHSFRILRKAYRIISVRQLVSNRKEVTLFLRKRS